MAEQQRGVVISLKRCEVGGLPIVVDGLIRPKKTPSSKRQLKILMGMTIPEMVQKVNFCLHPHLSNELRANSEKMQENAIEKTKGAYIELMQKRC